jgi:glycosyltransferase involved in cell wall biosynthesis
MSISVITPTIGRLTLGRCVKSVFDQLEDGDEHLVEVDFPCHFDWGSAARDAAIQRAKGTHVWFIDDDDIANPGALEAIRKAVSEDPDCAWMFKIQGTTDIYWKERDRIAPGNFQGQNIIVPRAKSPKWDTIPGAVDWHYIQNVRSTMEIKWAEAIICTLRPKGGLFDSIDYGELPDRR